MSFEGLTFFAQEGSRGEALQCLERFENSQLFRTERLVRMGWLFRSLPQQQACHGPTWPPITRLALLHHLLCEPSTRWLHVPCPLMLSGNEQVFVRLAPSNACEGSFSNEAMWFIGDSTTFRKGGWGGIGSLDLNAILKLMPKVFWLQILPVSACSH